MKIVYSHLLNFLEKKPSIEELSKKLFQLGHEHELEGEIFDLEIRNNGILNNTYSLILILNTTIGLFWSLDRGLAGLILATIFLRETANKETWVAILITFFSVTFIFYDSVKIGNFYGDMFGIITALGLALNAIIVR